MDSNPTRVTYEGLDAAYDFFNRELFAGRLPRCLVTLQRQNGARGYFYRERFITRDGKEVTDEIALNPAHFRERSVEEALSTLVHEMTHLEQFHFGNPSRSGYHNREWAGLMAAVGLIASDTAAPGGKKTGQRMSHYIEPGGAFARVCSEFLALGFVLPYVDVADDQEARKAKIASKSRFTCASCGQHAWGKPDLSILCGKCDVPMLLDGSGKVATFGVSPQPRGG